MFVRPQEVSSPPFTVGAGNWPRILELGHNIWIWSCRIFDICHSFCVRWIWTWQKCHLWKSRLSVLYGANVFSNSSDRYFRACVFIVSWSVLFWLSLWLCVDESYVEDDLLCLLNTGEVCVFTVPSLRRQIVANVIGRDNVMSVFLHFCDHSLYTLCSTKWRINTVRNRYC